MKGGPFEAKKSFDGKSHSAEKNQRGDPFRFAKVTLKQKKLKGDPLLSKKIEKSLTMPKKYRTGTLIMFSAVVCSTRLGIAVSEPAS